MNISLNGLNNYISKFNAILISGPSICFLAHDLFFELKNNRPDIDVWLIDLDCSVNDLTREFDKLLMLNNKMTVILANNASSMSTNVANKLLKIVEEPPVNIKFVFLANNASRVIPTIISRCVEIPQSTLLSADYNESSRCAQNSICQFFLREFEEQDFPTLLQAISCESGQPIEDVFEYILLKAKEQNYCLHPLNKCAYFCRLEGACKNVSKARQNYANSKLIWQAIFCQTLAKK